MTDRVAPEELVVGRRRVGGWFAGEVMEGGYDGPLVWECPPGPEHHHQTRGEARACAVASRRAAQYITRLEGENERLRGLEREAQRVIRNGPGWASTYAYQVLDAALRTALSHSAPKEGS